MNFYSFLVKTPAGKNLDLSIYRDKVVLVVNTATQCGLTPQFEGLEKLHQEYQDKGLVVLGFPCNQFLKQEPTENESMEEVCRVNHGVTFQLTEKINVNGKNSHPLYKYLKKKIKKGPLSSRIRWNFEKFLIDKNGNPIKRYLPTTKPEDIEQDIKEILGVG